MQLRDLLAAFEELSSATVACEYRIEDARRELVRLQRLVWLVRREIIAAADDDDDEATGSAPGVCESLPSLVVRSL